jgi:CheY-like chemotaxis protein
MLIKQALEMENYVIIQAENGFVAQQKLSGGAKPCVILLDLMMPIMNGQEFLEWKNSHSDHSNIPVIVISALAQHMELPGTVKYLRKPIDLKDMIDTVAKVCC